MAPAFCGRGHWVAPSPQVSKGVTGGLEERAELPLRTLAAAWGPSLPHSPVGRRRSRCGGRGRRGGGGRPHREGRLECASRRYRDWLAATLWRRRLRGPGLGPQGRREGARERPRAAGTVERAAASKKDELVSGRPGRRFFFLMLPLQTVGTKARAGVRRARTIQP